MGQIDLFENYLYHMGIINSYLKPYNCVLNIRLQYLKSDNYMQIICLFVFYGISTFVGYLMPNPFLYKWTVLFQTIQVSISTQFNCPKHFYFKLFIFNRTVQIQTIQFSISIVFIHTQLNVKTILFQTIQFGVSTVSMSKTVLFQTIQFSISTQFKYQNSSISSNSV